MKVTTMNNTTNNSIAFVNGYDQTVNMITRSVEAFYAIGFIAPFGRFNSNNFINKLLCRHTPFCGLLRLLKEESAQKRLVYSFT